MLGLTLNGPHMMMDQLLFSAAIIQAMVKAAPSATDNHAEYCHRDDVEASMLRRRSDTMLH
jgi:hypothetical protein